MLCEQWVDTAWQHQYIRAEKPLEQIKSKVGEPSYLSILAGALAGIPFIPGGAWDGSGFNFHVGIARALFCGQTEFENPETDAFVSNYAKAIEGVRSYIEERC